MADNMLLVDRILLIKEFNMDNEKSGDELWDSVNEAIDNHELQQYIQNLQNKGLKGITVKCEG